MSAAALPKMLTIVALMRDTREPAPEECACAGICACERSCDDEQLCRCRTGCACRCDCAGPSRVEPARGRS